MNVPRCITLTVLLLCPAPMALMAAPPPVGVTVTGLGSLLPAKIDYLPREICAPFGFDESGRAVGRAAAGRDRQEDTGRAFLSINGKMTDLGVLPGYGGGSCALAINGSGWIVGCSGKTQADEDIKDTHAFLYRKGAMTDLGTLGGTYSKACAINKSGLIAGESTTASGERHAFIYADGKMRDLGSYKGYKFFRVNGMNDSGEIVGAMSLDADENDPHAFYCKAGRFYDLGTFGGTSSVAHAVNNAGDIVGEYSVKGKAHAFIFTGGKMKDLTASVDTRDSLGAIATLINNRGELLLMVPGNDHITRNYVCKNGKAVNLAALLKPAHDYSAKSVASINDAGQLLCFGVTPAGNAGFLVTPGKGW